jgi:hypothetical protein
MRKFRWISIVLLVLGGAGLGYKLRADWRSFRAVNDPAVIKVRPLPPSQVPAPAAAPDYGVVAQQNPFHPERNDAMPPPPPPPPAKTAGPPPLVYGSMLLGKEKYALMASESDPKPRKVNEGEEFQGYKLAEVRPQSVVLELDGAKNEVMFYNALTRLKRDMQKTQSTAGGAPAATVASSAAAPGTTQTAAQSAPPLPPPIPGTPAPPGKVLQETPFGSLWVDKK